MSRLEVIQPDPDLLEGCLEQEDRIKYFQTKEKRGSWTDIQEHFEFRMEDSNLRKDIQEFLYREYMLNPLAKVLSELHPSQRLGVRGIAVTVYNPVKFEDFEIMTLPNVLKNGTELQGENKTRLALLSGGSINKCVSKYLRVAELFREETPSPKYIEWIFPGVLVYDVSKLRRDREDEEEKNQWNLPRSEEERESVILNAYILDYLEVLED